jgi:hypothetical protein
MHKLITQSEHTLIEDLNMSEKPQLTMRYLLDLIEKMDERIAFLENKLDNKDTKKKIVIIEDKPMIIKKASK